MVSIIIPLYNEQDSLRQLCAGIAEVAGALGGEWELILVDDGSNDGSKQVLLEVTRDNPHIVACCLKRRYGQTLAIAAGIERAKGELLVFMDADLQNDPRDIPRLLEKLREGYDGVVGWRRHRKDPFMSRIVPSLLGNKLVSLITGFTFHDVGCGLRVFKKSALTDITLYGEMHRLLPVYAKINGARIAEVAVSHNSRIKGKSKYGPSRTVKLLLDLMNIELIQRFHTKPLYLLGSVGLSFIFLGSLIGSFVLLRTLLWGGAWISPLLFISLLFFVQGIQILFTGIVAELLVKVHYRIKEQAPYRVKAIVASGVWRDA